MPRRYQIRVKSIKLQQAALISDDSDDSGENSSAAIIPRASTPNDETPNPILLSADNVRLSIPNAEYSAGSLSQNLALSESSFLARSLVSNADSNPAWSIGSSKSKITEEELIIILLAIQSIHRASDITMDSFCVLLNGILPPNNRVPTSFRQVIRLGSEKFDDFDGRISYICSGKNCLAQLQKQFDRCKVENCEFYNRSHQNSGFVTYKIRPQVELIIRKYFSEIQREILKARMARSSTGVSDVMTSPAYSENLQRLHLKEDELPISLILSADGAQPFKCGRSGLWPCVAIVAELPPKIRSSMNNCIVVGFWIANKGNKKPIWPLFLRNAIDELVILRDGFSVIIEKSLIRIRLTILCTLFDLPAQASIWSHKQFNGKYGCIACCASGEYSQSAKAYLWPKTRDRRPKSAYFFEIAWAKLMDQTTEPYRGVVGVSPLAKLINPANANIFDPMHLIYQGNAYLIGSRFFQSLTGKWTPLFRQKEQKEFNADMEKVKYPFEFNRTVPNMDQLASFKASELKNFLLYVVLPVSAPFMSDIPEFWHWTAIYVHAIRLLSQESVTNDDAFLAKSMIDTWQKLLPIMTNEKSQNYNAHAVQHLPRQVMQFGALWTMSAFCFESFNGFFLRMINSAKGPIQQITRRFLLQRYATTKLPEISKNPTAAKIISKITSDRNLSSNRNDNESRLRIGKITINYDDGRVIHTIQKEFNQSINGAKFSDCAFINGLRFESQAKRLTKCSCVVKFIEIDEQFGIDSKEYADISVFVEINNRIYAIGKKFHVIAHSNRRTVPAPKSELLLNFYNEESYGSFYIHATMSDEFVVIPLEDILCKVILIPYYDEFILTDVLPFEHN